MRILPLFTLAVAVLVACGDKHTDTPSTPDTSASELLRAAPGHTDTSGAQAAGWDLSLRTDSLLRDAGAPDILDADGSASDIGAHGGPGGW